MFVDGQYTGETFRNEMNNLKIRVEEIKKPEGQGFQVVKKRWVVERTFGWFGKWRILSKDYEGKMEISEGVIQAVSVRIMIARLAREGQPIREKRPMKKAA